jgi:hypothetical protein
MLRAVWRFVFPCVPVELRSALPPEEASRRVRAATEPSLLRALFKTCVWGTVSVDRVRLERLVPLLGNNFKPVFTGAFVADGGGSVLRGQFAARRFVQAFFTIWLSLALAFFGIALAGALGVFRTRAEATAWPGLLFGSAGAVLWGLALLRGGWAFSKSDIARIEEVLTSALKGAP